LVRLCGLLKEHGVATLALKGPALAAAAYGDIALRQFTDLDILVRERDLVSALAVLQTDGYCSSMPLHGSPAAIPGASQVTLVKPGVIGAIDLHWRLSPSYFALTPEGEELWQRATEVQLNTSSVLTLGHQNLILHLCVHGARHGWQSLSGICDIAAVTRRFKFDWKSLTEHASQLGSLRALLLGCLLAYELLEAEVPESLIAAARCDAWVGRSKRIFYRYFRRLDLNPPRLFQRWLIPASMLSHRAPRLKYILARAFLPAAADWELVTLPRPLSSIYYCIRPLRLTIQNGLKLLTPLLNQ
jgi:hypothetical protein